LSARCSPLGNYFAIVHALNSDIPKAGWGGVTVIIPRNEMLKHVREIGVIGRRLSVRKYERNGGEDFLGNEMP
jgi:hypothetical protein